MKTCVLANVLAAFWLSLPVFTTSLSAQNWKWLGPGVTGAGNYTDTHNAVAVDAAGCVYTTGIYTPFTTTPNYRTYPRISLNKYTPGGAPLYKKDFDVNTSNDVVEEGLDIAVSLADNKVVVGGYTFTHPYLGIFDATFGFVITQVPFSGNGRIEKIDLRNGVIWVIGNFYGTLSLGSGYTFNGSPSPTEGDIFIAKYNLNGTVLAAMHISGPASFTNLKGYDIKVDVSNNAYITASTWHTAFFQVASNATFTPTSGKAEIFVAKLNSNLTDVLWTQSIEIAPAGIPFDARYPIALFRTPLEADVFVVGGLNGTLQGSFLQQRAQGNALLLSQLSSIPGHEIRDLAVPVCTTLGIYATGYTQAQICTTKAFLSKFDRTSCAPVWNRFSNTCGFSQAVDVNAGGNPVVAGRYDASVFKLGGPSLAHPNKEGAFAALFKDAGGCCPNRGLNLDGADDYLQTNNAPLIGNGNFTVEAWVFSFTSGSSCVTNFRRWLGWEGPGAKIFEIGECSGLVTVNYDGGSPLVSVPGINIRNGWHHIAVSKSGPTMRVYVDGVPGATQNVGFMNLAGPLKIGRATGTANNGTETWQGRLDEIRVWNVARSQSEILAVKNCAINPRSNNLVLYYPLDQGAPSGANAGAVTAYDFSPTGAHLSLHNFTLGASLSNWVCATSPVSDNCSPGPKLALANAVGERADFTPDAPGAPEVLVFPNPASGDITLELAEPAAKGATIRVISATGLNLLETQTEAGALRSKIATEYLPAGLYFLQILLDGQLVAAAKFVKQ